MNMLVFSICVTVVAVLGGSDGFMWTEESTRQGAIIQTCLGEEVSLPWQFITETDETVVNVEWYKNSEGTETILANFNGGQFFTSPVTHLKLSLLFNAGLKMANLSWADYGTFSVRVKVVQNEGQLRSISREAVISPPDAPVLAGGRLVAQRVLVPVTDNVTGELHAQLKCGTFHALGSRPVTVVWKTPSGQTVPSTDRSADTFFLTLQNPIEGGTYSCHLANNTALQACVKNAQSVSSLKRGAFVQLDETETQLSILGAQAKTLFSRDQDVRSSLKKEVNLLRQDLQQCNLAGNALTSKVRELRQELSKREKTENDLQRQVVVLQRHVEVLNTSTYSQVNELRQELSKREKTEQDFQRQVEVLNTSTYSQINELRQELSEREKTEKDLRRQVEVLNSRSNVYWPKPKSCVEVMEFDRTNGVHTLNVSGHDVTAYCDQTTSGGGWAVIQRRETGDVDFYRDWDDYQRGFGSPVSEYWLGLENIHQMTKTKNYKLRVDLTAFDGTSAYAEYDQFYVDGADQNYRLHVSGYSGTAESNKTRGLMYSNNMQFTTRDRQHDGNNCAGTTQDHGAWWYTANCGFTNLNGVYKKTSYRGVDAIFWHAWKGTQALKRTEMKIRPA